MTDAPSGQTRGGRIRAWLRGLGIDRTCLVLGAVALLVYTIGSTWGIPQATSAIMDRGWDVDGIGGMNTLAELHNLLIQPKADWYTPYPLLHYLILGAIYAPYLATLKLTGGFGLPSENYPYGFEDPVLVIATLAVLARVVTVLMATGVIVATYLVAKTLWDQAAATWAALAVLLLSPMLFYGRTSNLDVPVLFWTSLGLVVAVRSLTSGLTQRRAIAIGLFAALAVATKDQAYAAWVPGLLALALTVAPAGAGVGATSGTKGRPWGHFAWLAGTGAVIYAVANGIPFRPSRFLSHLDVITGFERSFFNLQHPSTLTVLRPATPAGYAALAGDAVQALVVALGLIILVGGIVGAVMAWRRSPASRVLVWMAVGFLVLAVFPIRHMQYRYTLFLGLVLSLFAGYAWSRAQRMTTPWRWLALGLLGAGLGWQAIKGIDITHQMLRDARYQAGDWLAASAQSGDRLAWFGISHQLPHLEGGIELVDLTRDSTAAERLESGNIRFVVVAADYFSDAARERSLFLPDSIYTGLKDGALGYELAQRFETPSLIGRPIRYLPYLNPTVQIFERRSRPPP